MYGKYKDADSINGLQGCYSTPGKIEYIYLLRTIRVAVVVSIKKNSALAVWPTTTGAYGLQYMHRNMFFVFKKKGVMDKATGIPLPKRNFGERATEPEINMVEKFIGRKSNSVAFLESLDIQK